jgi:uncharacterized protein (DUF4415 family)
MNERNTVRRTQSELRRGRTDWERLRDMPEAEVEANALADADNPPWGSAELAAAELMMPEEVRKIPVSIRLDPDVVAYFKAGGRGYQSRINAVLSAYVRSRTRHARR